MRVIYSLIIISLLFLQSCQEEDAPKPILVTSLNGTTFYPDQLVEIKWEGDRSKPIDMQLIVTEDSHFPESGEIAFDTLSGHTSLYGQSSYGFYMSSELDRKLFYGYRIRYKGAGKSGWTPIQYFNIFPYSVLDVKYATVKATFNFEAKENNSYWSDLVVSEDMVDLNQALLDNDFDLSKLEIVKFDSGFVVDAGDSPEHLDRIVIGVGEKDASEETFPFNVWADAYGIMHSPTLTFTPFGGMYRNLRDEIGGKKLPMTLAYFLSTFHEQ